jgi:hypothetical protein
LLTEEEEALKFDRICTQPSFRKFKGDPGAVEFSKEIGDRHIPKGRHFLDRALMTSLN